eukprot:8223792-Alexandrium_andersonii.AAC.1
MLGARRMTSRQHIVHVVGRCGVQIMWLKTRRLKSVCAGCWGPGWWGGSLAYRNTHVSVRCADAALRCAALHCACAGTGTTAPLCRAGRS